MGDTQFFVSDFFFTANDRDYLAPGVVAVGGGGGVAGDGSACVKGRPDQLYDIPLKIQNIVVGSETNATVSGIAKGWLLWS